MGDKLREEHYQSVVLFDGVCHLCQHAVKFIIQRDPDGYFQFASLQSDAAAALLGRSLAEGEAPGSLVLVENGRHYTRSEAALRIARRLRRPWPAFYLLMAVPRFLRDKAYDIIAARRYRWFGKDISCMMPTPELRERFLEDGKKPLDT